VDGGGAGASRASVLAGWLASSSGSAGIAHPRPSAAKKIKARPVMLFSVGAKSRPRSAKSAKFHQASESPGVTSRENVSNQQDGRTRQDRAWRERWTARVGEKRVATRRQRDEHRLSSQGEGNCRRRRHHSRVRRRQR